MKNIVVLLSAICLVALASCGPNYIYQQEKQMENGVWTYRDSAVFEFDVQDTAFLYNLYFNLAAREEFPYENLYVYLHTVFPDGKRMGKSHSFEVFDRQGKILGTSSGDVRKQHIMLQENTFFNQKGKYRIVVEQYMRQDSLPNVVSVGLDIEQKKEKK